MLNTTTPAGAVMRTPETLDEDQSHLLPDDLAGAREFHGAEGHVVLCGLVPEEFCARARSDARARASPVPIPRQRNMRHERNRFDASGSFDNPILNVQDFGSRPLGAFRDAVLDIPTHRAAAAATAALLGTVSEGG